jgi:3-dehydroquinate synthase
MISIESGIVFGPELCGCIHKLNPSHVFIVTDSVVGPLYGPKLKNSLSCLGCPVHILEFPAGDVHKTRATKEYLEDQMLQKSAGRDTCIIALGGGVVLDVAGYLASTYCRGVPLIMVPTSLLAMNDASIGGKNAVNTPYGKNLIGTTYLPQATFCDLDFLETLPLEELKNGFVEMIKHAIILDADFFAFLQTNAKALLNLDMSKLAYAVQKSCELKMLVVRTDTYEEGLRRILNFGHTVGHAIELKSEYRVSHGRAVASGIIVEAAYAVRKGYLQPMVLEQIKALFSSFGIETMACDGFSEKDLYECMCMDKKALKHRPRVVIIKEIGQVESFDGAFCTEYDVLEMGIL